MSQEDDIEAELDDLKVAVTLVVDDIASLQAQLAAAIAAGADPAKLADISAKIKDATDKLRAAAAPTP